MKANTSQLSSPGKKNNITNTLHIQTYSPTRHKGSPRSLKGTPKGSSPPKKLPLFDPELTSSPTPSKVKEESINMTDELLFEDTFCSHLAGLKRLLLQYTSTSPTGKSGANSSDPYLDQRAAQLVNEDIRRTLVKMHSLRGEGAASDKRVVSDKIAAYSYVSANITTDLATLLANEETHKALKLLQEELEGTSGQYRALQCHASNESVQHINKMARLETENKELLEKLTALVRRNNTLSNELDMRLHMEEEAHAKYVQLHLQSVNYHTRVNQLVRTASTKISSRMGFVPRGVHESLEAVTELQAPGADASYMQSGAASTRRKKSSSKNKGGLAQGIQLLRASSRSGDEFDEGPTTPKGTARREMKSTSSSSQISSRDISKLNISKEVSGSGQVGSEIDEFDDVYNLPPAPPSVPETNDKQDMTAMMQYLQSANHSIQVQQENGGGLGQRSIEDEIRERMEENDPVGASLLPRKVNAFAESPITASRSFVSEHVVAIEEGDRGGGGQESSSRGGTGNGRDDTILEDDGQVGLW